MASEVTKFINNPSVMNRIEERLKGKSGQFVTSLLSVVNNNGLIAQCKPETVLNAAMTAASLDLPINQNLGFAYIIPYKNKGVYEAQFQLGARGVIQLAQRSGQYKTIAATAVYDGQLTDSNPLTGNTYDWKAKTSDDVLGYVGYFKLINGFEKENYMSMDEILAHAKQYSQSFRSGYGPWKDNFDAMAQKTVLKLLLSKFGPLSTEMQTAIASDQAVIEDDNSIKYVDNDALDGEKATADERAAIIAAQDDDSSQVSDDDLDNIDAALETATKKGK